MIKYRQNKITTNNNDNDINNDDNQNDDDNDKNQIITMTKNQINNDNDKNNDNIKTTLKKIITTITKKLRKRKKQ